MSQGHKLKGAVIGVGYLGQFHAQKLHSNQDVDLCGVFDPHTEQASKVASQLGTKAYHQLSDVAKEVDFVTIAAATKAHYELAEYFLSQGKAVLVEKPIAATSEQGFKLAELADKKNLIFSVGHIERFNPAYQPIIDSASSTIYFEITRWAPFRMRGADVSVLHDLMIHDLDLIQYIFKSKVKSWMVSGHKIIQPTIDDVSVRLVLENNLQVTINNSRLHPEIVRHYRALQKDRTLFVNTANLEGQILTKSQQDPFFTVQKFQLSKVDALNLEICHFVKAVKKEVPVAISPFEACLALQTVEQINSELEN